jgi:hypothetical protein
VLIKTRDARGITNMLQNKFEEAAGFVDLKSNFFDAESKKCVINCTDGFVYIE